MKHIFSLVFSSAIIFFNNNAIAQRFGGNPSSVKWKQVNSPQVRVIFTQGHDSAAQRVAAITRYMLSVNDSSIGKLYKKLNIVLQPDLNFSNAYVGLGPYRSEFYTIPPQNAFDLGAVRWTDNLAWHEVRHAQQYSNYNRGGSKLMRILFGQSGQALANALTVPDWFFEGDAVWNETRYTQQGRGRMPSFFNEYRALHTDGKKYNYNKLRNGSYKDFVPSHYHLGYVLTAYGREKFGDAFWTKVSNDAAAFKPAIYPWQGAFKRHASQTFKSFKYEALEDFRKRSAANTRQQPSFITPTIKNSVVNYLYPQVAGDNRIVALKTGYRHIPQFVYLDTNGYEEKIVIRDISYDDYFSYKNGRIVYSALHPDARWSNQDFNVIRVYDTKSSNSYTVGSRTRYFSPDINYSGDRLTAVHANGKGLGDIVLLDTEGKELSRLHQDNLFFSQPKFINDEGTEIVAISRNPDGDMGILTWQPNSGATKWILSPANRLLGYPVVHGDSLLFTSTQDSLDVTAIVSLKGGSPIILQQYSSGTYQAVIINNQLLASYFTSSGYRLGLSEINFATQLNDAALPALYASQGRIENTERKIDNINLPVSKYAKTSGFFNFHSWIPEASLSEYAFTLMGSNILNTTSTELGYRYNVNERSHALEGSFFYGGWYLQPLIDGAYTWGREVNYNADTTFIYDESKIGAGFQLPLNFTRGKLYKYLNFSATINQNNVVWKGIGDKLLNDQRFTYYNPRLSFSMQTQRALQQIYPCFAFTTLADYKRSIDAKPPWQFLSSSAIYLPGFAKTHSLVVQGAFQSRDTLNQYSFSNSFPFSRGYEDVNLPRLMKVGANYHFPLIYPDFGFGNVIYVYRLRANAFYDFTRGKSLRTGRIYDFASAGGELYADLNLWNQLPFSVGVRYSYLLNDPVVNNRKSFWEIILPIDIL